MKDNIINVFGPQFANSLMPISICINRPDSAEEDQEKIEGFVSQLDNGIRKTTSDKQFCFINGRPSDMPKVF